MEERKEEETEEEDEPEKEETQGEESEDEVKNEEEGNGSEEEEGDKEKNLKKKGNKDAEPTKNKTTSTRHEGKGGNGRPRTVAHRVMVKPRKAVSSGNPQGSSTEVRIGKGSHNVLASGQENTNDHAFNTTTNSNNKTTNNTNNAIAPKRKVCTSFVCDFSKITLS